MALWPGGQTTLLSLLSLTEIELIYWSVGIGVISEEKEIKLMIKYFGVFKNCSYGKIASNINR